MNPQVKIIHDEFKQKGDKLYYKNMILIKLEFYDR